MEPPAPESPLPESSVPEASVPEASISESSAPYKPRCMYLTCKSMLVWGEDFQNDPEFQAGMVEFTCNQTMQNLGPDGDLLSLDLCSNPERSCFQEY